MRYWIFDIEGREEKRRERGLFFTSMFGVERSMLDVRKAGQQSLVSGKKKRRRWRALFFTLMFGVERSMLDVRKAGQQSLVSGEEEEEVNGHWSLVIGEEKRRRCAVLFFTSMFDVERSMLDVKLVRVAGDNRES